VAFRPAGASAALGRIAALPGMGQDGGGRAGGQLLRGAVGDGAQGGLHLVPDRPDKGRDIRGAHAAAPGGVDAGGIHGPEAVAYARRLARHLRGYVFHLGAKVVRSGVAAPGGIVGLSRGPGLSPDTQRCGLAVMRSGGFRSRGMSEGRR